MLHMDQVWSKNVPRPNWSDVGLERSSTRTWTCTNTGVIRQWQSSITHTEPASILILIHGKWHVQWRVYHIPIHNVISVWVDSLHCHIIDTLSAGMLLLEASKDFFLYLQLTMQTKQAPCADCLTPTTPSGRQPSLPASFASVTINVPGRITFHRPYTIHVSLSDVYTAHFADYC